MTSADNGDKTIYLNGRNVRYRPVRDIIELYETPEGRANSLMTLDELLMKSLGRNDVSDRIKLANYFWIRVLIPHMSKAPTALIVCMFFSILGSMIMSLRRLCWGVCLMRVRI